MRRHPRFANIQQVYGMQTLPSTSCDLRISRARADDQYNSHHRHPEDRQERQFASSGSIHPIAAPMPPPSNRTHPSLRRPESCYPRERMRDEAPCVGRLQAMGDDSDSEDNDTDHDDDFQKHSSYSRYSPYHVSKRHGCKHRRASSPKISWAATVPMQDVSNISWPRTVAMWSTDLKDWVQIPGELVPNLFASHLAPPMTISPMAMILGFACMLASFFVGLYVGRR